jgi:hypothetical protein
LYSYTAATQQRQNVLQSANLGPNFLNDAIDAQCVLLSQLRLKMIARAYG